MVGGGGEEEEEEKIVAERGSSGGGILRASAYVDGAGMLMGAGGQWMSSAHSVSGECSRSWVRLPARMSERRTPYLDG